MTNSNVAEKAEELTEVNPVESEEPKVESDPAVLLPPLFQYVRTTPVKRLINKILAEQQRTEFYSLSALSEYPGEGRTFLVSAVALGYAVFLNKRVLVIDTTHQEETARAYLGPVLSRGQFSEKKETGVPGVVDVVTTKTLGSFADGQNSHIADFGMRAYIESVRSDYDLVLLDTCALSCADLESFDPLILAEQTDQSILITSKRSLKRELVDRVKADLAQCEISLLGTVFNHGDSL